MTAPPSSCRFLGTLILICAAGLASASTPAGPIKQVRYVMGTLCEITLYPSAEEHSEPPGTAEERATAALDAAFDELKRIDTVLSNWNSDSDLMRMNLRAASPGNLRPRVRVSDELFERLQVALRIAGETRGAFDPTVGPLVRAWGFLPPCATPVPCRKETRAAAIAEAKRRVGWQKVTLYPETKEVQFAVPAMEIDLGGIAKGYAVERAIQILKEHGIRSALVNLGKSSLKALGPPPRQPDCAQDRADECRAWPVSVVDPRDRRQVAARIYLHDGDALATSGTYENTIGKGKNRRSHLIDPSTGRALGGEASVSVICSDAEAADALTKPFILRGDLKSASAGQVLRLYPQCGVVLISVQRGQLERRTAGRLESRAEGGTRTYSMAAVRLNQEQH